MFQNTTGWYGTRNGRCRVKLCQCQEEVLPSSRWFRLSFATLTSAKNMGATPVSARLLLKYSSPVPLNTPLFVSFFFVLLRVTFILFFSFVSSQTSAQFSFKKEITVLQSYILSFSLYAQFHLFFGLGRIQLTDKDFLTIFNSV